MQIKTVIGTVAFMLTMIILGFAALREPARLQEFTLAREGRTIETGASLFQGNCATCHGIDGRAQECFDANGNPIACVGFPLNAQQLVCGDRSARMEALNWEGSKEQFVLRTVAAGRSGTQMPAWSDRYGGPMRDDQVQNVSTFVLNWESEEFCSQPVVTYDWPELVEEFLAQEDIEAGDAEAGAEAYQTYGCVACHGDPDEPGTNLVGPWLGDIAEVGATRVEGQSAGQYVYESILEPDAFIAPDCPTGPCAGPPSQMRQDYPSTIGNNPSDMAHLLAFLLGDALPEE
jgi:mono/diheme cytochrome c family protein